MSVSRVCVTSCNLRFADGAEALLRSACRCHPEVEKICYVPAREHSVLSARLSSWARVEVFPSIIQGVPEENLANVGRLFSVIPDAETVVYVDSDVVFCRPAPELWDVEPGTVNAVRDTSIMVANNLAGPNRDLFVRQFPDVASHKGANMGVFGLRPSDWKDLPQRFSRALVDGGFGYDYIIDQPLLNALIAPHFHWLPFEFNAHCLFDNRISRDVRLVHFTGGGAKPWQAGFPKHEPAYWYWLKYGEQEQSAARLMISALGILLHTPKRLLGRKIREWKQKI